MPPCLTLGILRYKSRVSGAIQGKELRLPLLLSVVANEKGAFGSPPTTVGKLTIYIYISGDHRFSRKSPRDVMVIVLIYCYEVSRFELQSRSYIHFRIKTLRKSPLSFHKLWIQQCRSCSSTRLICHKQWNQTQLCHQCHSCSYFNIIYYMYLPTPQHRQDVTQGQFLSRV